MIRSVLPKKKTYTLSPNRTLYVESGIVQKRKGLLYFPGEYLGLFDDDIVDCVGIQEAQVVAMSPEDFDFPKSPIRTVGGDMIHKYFHAHRVSRKSAAQKAAWALATVAAHTKPLITGEYAVKGIATKVILQHAGLARQTGNYVFKELDRLGLVHIKNKVYFIPDLDELKEFTYE